ncbi:MAG: glycoside hydrolase family 16 protein [Spirochaetes bacterium]|nr:glycoside hydrolase family 16 protein [Spirochaetota bacterium]
MTRPPARAHLVSLALFGYAFLRAATPVWGPIPSGPNASFQGPFRLGGVAFTPAPGAKAEVEAGPDGSALALAGEWSAEIPAIGEGVYTLRMAFEAPANPKGVDSFNALIFEGPGDAALRPLDLRWYAAKGSDTIRMEPFKVEALKAGQWRRLAIVMDFGGLTLTGWASKPGGGWTKIGEKTIAAKAVTRLRFLNRIGGAPLRLSDLRFERGISAELTAAAPAPAGDTVFTQGATQADGVDDSDRPESVFRVSLRAAEARLPGKAYAIPRGFSYRGDWQPSSKYLGFFDSSRWTHDDDGAAFWNPDVKRAGTWRVSTWKIVTGTEGDDRTAPFSVYHAGRIDTATLDLSQGSQDWAVLGTWEFTADRDEWVECRPGSQKGKYTRLGEMRFERLDAAGKVVETAIVDLARMLPTPPFTDLQSLPAKAEWTTLWRKGIAVPAAFDRFGAASAMPLGDLVLLAVRASGKTNLTTVAAAWPEASRLGIPKALGIGPKDSARIATRLEGATLFSALSAAMGKPKPAAELLAFLTGPARGGESLDRGEAHLLARRFLHRVLYPGPREGAGWKPVFEDDFAGSTLGEGWISQHGPSGHILSSRWRENAVVSNGALHLLQRKEARGGQEWTSGSVWTKKQWQYGYLECSYRYAAAVGINQSFWMFSDPRDPRVELDQNEGWYPDIINPHYIIHFKEGGKSKPKTFGHKPYYTLENLAEDFHVYGLAWDEKELVYYFDGEEINRIPNEHAHAPVSIYFSTAISHWAGGRATKAIDGTHMDVEWVRVWQR